MRMAPRTVMVVRRRASIDVPAPGGPSKGTLWAERLHSLRVRLDVHEDLRPCGRWSPPHV